MPHPINPSASFTSAAPSPRSRIFDDFRDDDLCACPTYDIPEDKPNTFIMWTDAVDSAPVAAAAGPGAVPVRPLTPAIESRALAPKNRASADENRISAAESQALVAESRAPVAESRAPVAESRAPVAESRAPVAESRAPVAESRAPVAESRAPVAESRAPVAESRAPVAGSPVPGLPSDNSHSLRPRATSAQRLSLRNDLNAMAAGGVIGAALYPLAHLAALPLVVPGLAGLGLLVGIGAAAAYVARKAWQAPLSLLGSVAGASVGVAVALVAGAAAPLVLCLAGAGGAVALAAAGDSALQQGVADVAHDTAQAACNGAKYVSASAVGAWNRLHQLTKAILLYGSIATSSFVLGGLFVGLGGLKLLLAALIM